MRVLFICQHIPYAESNGIEVKIANLLRCMRQVAEVRCAFLVDDTEQNRKAAGELGPKDAAVLRPRGSNALSRYLLHLNEHLVVGKEVKKRLQEMVVQAAPDLIWLEFGYSCRLIPFLRRFGLPICYGSHNSQWQLDYQIWRAGENPLERLKMLPFIGLYWPQERFLMGMADRLLCICEHDLHYYSRFVSRSKLGLLPFFFDCRQLEEVAPYSGGHPYICQVGSLRSRQNFQAALSTLEEIWPRVQDAGDLYLYIIGELPSEGSADHRLLMEKKARCRRVVFTGKVPSVIPYVKGALVNIVPLTLGSGVRTKIIESAACRTPVISTTVGAAGLPFRHGTSILIADDLGEFAEQVIGLVKDEEQRARLATEAYESYRQELSLEAGTAALSHVFSQLTAVRSGCRLRKAADLR